MTIKEVMDVMINEFTDEELTKIEAWLSTARKVRTKQKFQNDCEKLLNALDEFTKEHPYEKIDYVCPTCDRCNGIKIELEDISDCIRSQMLYQ